MQNSLSNSQARLLDRFHALLRSILDAIIIVNSSGRIVHSNERSEKLFGYDPGELAGLHLELLLPEKFRTAHAAHRGEYSAKPRTRSMGIGLQLHGLRKNGSEFPVEISLSPLALDEDTLTIATVRDITERLRQDNALREREAGLRHAEEMAMLSHVVTAADGSFESWSDTLPTQAGVAQSALPKNTRDWLRIVHPDDRQIFRSTAIDAGASRKRRGVEYRLQRPDGTLIHVRQTMEPLGEADADGTSRWFNTLQDVTDQKGAEERIKRLNRVYAVLSEINSAIVRLHDRQALFDEACRIAVAQGAFNLAWIANVDPETLEGNVVARHGHQPAYLQNLRFNARVGSPEADWPVSRAVREMKPVICNDVRTDAVLAPFRERLLEGGSLSVAMFPLIVGDRPEAVLTLYAREAGFFDDVELRLLNELAHDVAFGLEYIAKDAKLSYLAYYDALTDLPNSVLFHDRLAQALNSSADESRVVALYMIDLDRFTHINDTLGRHSGDALLKLVAQRLTAALPKSSSLARISADTFAVAVPDLRKDADDSVAVLENQLLATLREAFNLGEDEIRVSARAGIAIFPSDGRDADTLFKNAEAALQQAKASDERYLFYAPEMNARMAEKVALENQLREALEADQFVLFYQPVVELSSGEIIGAEALIRWQHPEQGLLSPGRFLPIAESTETILPIGHWVLRTACAQAKEWHDTGSPALRMSINLSPRQFRDETLVQRIAGALSDSGLDAHALELELTEDIVMQDAEHFIVKLNALKALGVKLSLDDFGTGYSSLSYLKRIPLDQLKVDQSFIHDVISNPDDAAIVRAVISLGHALELDIVAEGVETEAQVAWLQRQRCERIQGFYFSPPVTAAQFAAMLKDGKRLPAQFGAQQEKAKTLLVVDDETNVISAVVRLLRREGYRILTANGAARAFEILAANTVQVILSDHRMPVMTGADFLGKVKAMYPDTVRLLFSGHVEMDALCDAVNRGAVYRFLLKPWDDIALRESISEAFHYYWLTHRLDSDSPQEAGAE